VLVREPLDGRIFAVPLTRRRIRFDDPTTRKEDADRLAAREDAGRYRHEAVAPGSTSSRPAQLVRLESDLHNVRRLDVLLGRADHRFCKGDVAIGAPICFGGHCADWGFALCSLIVPFTPIQTSMRIAAITLLHRLSGLEKP
jgi:hypothetical protein